MADFWALLWWLKTLSTSFPFLHFGLSDTSYWECWAMRWLRELMFIHLLIHLTRNPSALTIQPPSPACIYFPKFTFCAFNKSFRVIPVDESAHQSPWNPAGEQGDVQKPTICSPKFSEGNSHRACTETPSYYSTVACSFSFLLLFCEVHYKSLDFLWQTVLCNYSELGIQWNDSTPGTLSKSRCFNTKREGGEEGGGKEENLQKEPRPHKRKQH